MNIFHPERFQGAGRFFSAMTSDDEKNSPYFEGYYYRAVAPDGRSISVIPGIAVNGGGHCFIQLMDSRLGGFYFRFPVEKFQYARGGLYLAVGGSAFSHEGYSLDLDGEITVKGTLRFKNPVAYPSLPYGPGIMGPFSFLPFMECNHGVVCVKSGLEGSLVIGGDKVDFDGGTGYIEKDWGSSFPSEYIWAQSGSFRGRDASFMLSAARGPGGPAAINGLIAFLYCEGRFWRFATYSGAYVKKILPRAGSTELYIAAPGRSLKVSLMPNTTSALKAPAAGEMSREIRESAGGAVEIELSGRAGTIFCGRGENAAIEICGIGHKE